MEMQNQGTELAPAAACCQQLGSVLWRLKLLPELSLRRAIQELLGQAVSH